MAVDNSSVVDVVSVNPLKACVILDIADQLDWTEEHEHLLTLEKKINEVDPEIRASSEVM